MVPIMLALAPAACNVSGKALSQAFVVFYRSIKFQFQLPGEPLNTRDAGSDDLMRHTQIFRFLHPSDMILQACLRALITIDLLLMDPLGFLLPSDMISRALSRVLLTIDVLVDGFFESFVVNLELGFACASNLSSLKAQSNHPVSGL